MVLQFFRDGDAMIVAAANDGGASDPGWYFNLRAEPAARVEVMGRELAVRAEELPPGEAAAWWQRILLRAPSYERYTRATARSFPIMRLVPIVGATWPGTGSAVGPHREAVTDVGLQLPDQVGEESGEGVEDP